ncbi:MAG: hypothetical protein AAB849_01185 [Patescibacteria group bacterium]
MSLSSDKAAMAIRALAKICGLSARELSGLLEANVKDVKDLVKDARRKFSLPDLEINPPFTVHGIVTAVKQARRRKLVREWLIEGPLTTLYGHDGARQEHLQLVSLTPEQVRGVVSNAVKRFRVSLEIEPKARLTPHDLIRRIARHLP